MNGQIFVSYRREDASYPAGRLYDQLQSRFPQNEIFMDVDSLKPGTDFVKIIEERVGACDVLVAVIGKRWLSAADEEGRRRLDNPEDFVRLEVGTALKRGVRVIPVLVEGASMPRSGDLPENLKPLVRRNALSVSHDGFRADAERLIDSVDEVLEAAQAERPPRPPEGPQTPRRRAPGQGKPERLPGLGAGPGAPAPDRNPLKWVTTNRKRPRRLLVVTGIGIVVCLLGVSLFKATRPQPVSTGGSSSPTPAPLAAALNSPSPTPLASQVSPSPSPSGAEGLTEAKRYLDLGDYAKALPPLQKAADAGDAVALNNLGVLYEKGLGVAQNYAQARQWFQKAAEAGNYHAMENLGHLYEKGLGVAQDYPQARRWFQKAADAGNAGARQALARLPSITSPMPASQASANPTPSGQLEKPVGFVAVNANAAKIGPKQEPRRPQQSEAQPGSLPTTSIWLFPDSNLRLLSDGDLTGLDCDQLWIARNEIYARNGYIFSTQKGRAYAATLGKPYQGTDANQDRVRSRMNSVERQNIERINYFERRRSCL
jgi:TPR repeat protein